MKNYRCITSVQEIQQYISNAAVVAFDYETAPDEPYRMASFQLSIPTDS